MLPRAIDASAAAEEVQVRRFRELGPRGRLAAALALNEALERLALAGIRARCGELSPREERLHLFALRLGPEAMRDAFGWTPADSRD